MPSTHPTKMRRYYIVSVILLMLPIIDLTVAAPALVQEKRQPDVDVVHIPEGAITMLGKRGFNELDEVWPDLFGDPGDHFSKPESSSAARPSSSSPPSGPAGGSTNVKQPLPSIPEEPSSVSSPDHAPQSADDKFDELLLKLLGGPKVHYPIPQESPAARLSSSLPPSGPAYWSTGVKQPLPSIPDEPSPVSSEDHAPPSPGSLTQSGYELMKGGAPPGPSGPASSTMSSADHKLMGAHALPNPGPSTESNHKMMGVPLSSEAELG